MAMDASNAVLGGCVCCESVTVCEAPAPWPGIYRQLAWHALHCRPGTSFRWCAEQRKLNEGGRTEGAGGKPAHGTA